MTTYPQVRRYPAATVGRLTPSGPYFVDAAGQLHIRRSITAFTAPKRFIEGRGDEVRRYFDWAASKGANEVRSFSSTGWTGPPHSGVETGWAYNEAACRQTFKAAAACGLHVEMVALTQPGSLEWMVGQIQAVDELCLQYENALLECANEPSRNGIDIAAVLVRYTPRTPGWASGQATPMPLPQPALTHHTGRDSEWPRKAKDANEFSTGAGPDVIFKPPFGGPVMLDEPKQIEETIREQGVTSASDDWAAYAAGCAFFGCGGTLHGNPDFQQCVIPASADVQTCVDAFYRGFAAVPLIRFYDYDRGDPPTPSDGGSRRYFRWSQPGQQGQKYQLTVRPFSFGQV